MLSANFSENGIQKLNRKKPAYLDVVEQLINKLYKLFSEWEEDIEKYSKKDELNECLLIESIELKHIFDLLIKINEDVIEYALENLITPCNKRTLSGDLSLKTFLHFNNLENSDDYTFLLSIARKLDGFIETFNQKISKHYKKIEQKFKGELDYVNYIYSNNYDKINNQKR